MPRPSTPKKSNLAAARARMYRELVFETAERVFSEQGFDETSMQELASEAGISLKTLYNTFSGKDDVYRAIVSARGAELLETMRGAVSEDGALEQLGAGVRATVVYLVDHLPFFRILLQEGHAWGLDPNGAEARRSWRASLDVMTSVLRHGMETGEFLPADPELLAPTVNAILQVQLAGILERPGEPDADAITDEILVPLQRLLCGGQPATGRAEPDRWDPGQASSPGSTSRATRSSTT